MADDKKKDPSQYPTMSFRISAKDKREIEREIKKQMDEKNAKLKPSDFKTSKADVIVEALRKGLRLPINKDG